MEQASPRIDSHVSSLLALAERCERDEPSRVIDSMIEVEVKGFTHFDPPPYTTSLDAAVTLVPDGWFWRVGRSTLYPGWASLNRTHPDNCNRWDEPACMGAKTPALALCAAALKARAAIAEQEQAERQRGEAHTLTPSRRRKP